MTNLAPLLHWPLVLLPLGFAVGALFAVVAILERRRDSRSLNQREKFRQEAAERRRLAGKVVWHD